MERSEQILSDALKAACPRYANRKDIEYIIGIDLGHGETSAAICPLQWDKPVGQLGKATDLEMGGNKKVLPSAIAIMDNGDAFIGDKAFRPDILKKASVSVCFKQKPQDIDGEKERLMIRFMHEVYRLILENNPATLHDGNHCVYIATPSGWDADAQRLYFKMAEKAGLPIAGVTKESRAAFVRAQQDVTSGLGRNVSKGAVVFDMGSSTLDFTYMNLSESSSLIDNGYDCGASFIEKTVLKTAEESTEVIRRFEQKYPKLRDRLLFEARTVKEQVYFDPTAKVKRFVNFEELIDDDADFEDERFKLMFEPGGLNRLLESVGYIKQIEDAMVDFKNNIIAGAPIYGVFLTGGASRMDFIKPLVAKVWQLPEESIHRDQDPSLTISEGVAEVARIDMRTEGMDEGLEDAINRVSQSNGVFCSFAESFGTVMKKKVKAEIADTVAVWRGSSEDRSLNDLQSGIKRNVNKAVNEAKAQASKYLNEAIEENTEQIRAMVEDIVSSYSNQGLSVKVPVLNCADIRIDSIDMDGVIENISSTIEVQSGNWLKWALMGVGAIFGLIGMGVGYLAGRIFGGGNLTEEEKRQKAMAKELDRAEREKVYDAIEEKFGDIARGIDDSIDHSIARNNSLRASVRDTVKRLLNDYKAELKKARILVD